MPKEIKWPFWSWVWIEINPIECVWAILSMINILVWFGTFVSLWTSHGVISKITKLLDSVHHKLYSKKWLRNKIAKWRCVKQLPLRKSKLDESISIKFRWLGAPMSVQWLQKKCRADVKFSGSQFYFALFCFLLSWQFIH